MIEIDRHDDIAGDRSFKPSDGAPLVAVVGARHCRSKRIGSNGFFSQANANRSAFSVQLPLGAVPNVVSFLIAIESFCREAMQRSAWVDLLVSVMGISSIGRSAG
jgi:hypothetical protein